MTLYVISGAAGMTGSELSGKIVEEGNDVIGFDNFFASSVKTIRHLRNQDHFRFYQYDLNSAEDMEKLEGEVKERRHWYDSLVYINCGAVVHTEHFYHVRETFETNVIGMKKLLEQAIRLKADVYINCSTSEVYSMQSWKEGGVKESDFIMLANAEHSQRTSYASGKLLTEFFMKDAVMERKIKGCSIRFANVYSKYERYPKHIIPHILNSLHREGKVELLENARKNRRTFLYNEDSCNAVLELIKAPDALDGSVYNVATEEEISIVDLVKLCAAKLEVSDPQITFRGYRESDPERRILNTEKIRARTNWKPQVTLEEGIEECVGELQKERLC